MTSEHFADIMNRIDDDMIIRAKEKVTAKPRGLWVKLASTAACLALVTLLAAGVMQSGLIGGYHVAELGNGDTIKFARSRSAEIFNLDIAIRTEFRSLTQAELDRLFCGLPVNADAVFNADDNAIVAIDGRIGSVKLVVTAPGAAYIDTVLEGEEGVSDIDGVPVAAGYAEIGKNIVYYADFELGGNAVHVEAGAERDTAEAVRTEVALAIKSLISLGTIDLASITAE